MGYITYSEMIKEHIEFLRSHGLDIDELRIDAGFDRRRELGCTKGRGELTYKTTSGLLRNGLIGLATWCRGANGDVVHFKNYGLDRKIGEKPPIVEHSYLTKIQSLDDKHEEAAKRAYGFWKNSSIDGFSDYLDRKKVGSYGLRFRNSEEYGRVAVVPMRDEHGKLWSYQLLNPDGSKRHPKDTKTEGLFHCLVTLINGRTIGIAESYATAATCYELTNIPMVCAFSCHNLPKTAKTLNGRFPDSPIVLFADNDKHLASNKGVLKAEEALDEIDGARVLAVPNFNGHEPSKDASDWNDLVRLEGKEKTTSQIARFFENNS